MRDLLVEETDAAVHTRRYARPKEALAATLADEATESFEAPVNRGVRTRVKSNTESKSGLPRPGMRTAGIRPGAELKSNEMRAIEAEEAGAGLAMRELDGILGARREESGRRPSIRREARREEHAREGRAAAAHERVAIAAEAKPAGPQRLRPEIVRVPLERNPAVSETRNIRRPRHGQTAPTMAATAAMPEQPELSVLGAPANIVVLDIGENTQQESPWGWVAAMVLAIAALGVSVYVAFGR